jgi:hypothetical protein
MLMVMINPAMFRALSHITDHQHQVFSIGSNGYPGMGKFLRNMVLFA